MSPALPPEEDREDFILSARYGDLEDIQAFVEKYGWECIPEIEDSNKNNVLHMASANGHNDIVKYLFETLAGQTESLHRLVTKQNASLSTPLHWAAVNSHLDTMKLLVTSTGSPGASLIDIKNSAGRTVLGEAELNGWNEGAAWLVSQMELPPAKIEESDVTGAEEVEEEDDIDDSEPIGSGEIEIEIQDADGGIGKLTLGPTKPGGGDASGS